MNSSPVKSSVPEVAVRVRGLCVQRGGRDVVVDAGFDIAVGEVVGLLGPSGCGKSTLMRTLVGVQANVRGDVTLLGRVAGSAELRGLVGYKTQEPAVYADLSVEENLRYVGALTGASRGEVERVIDDLDLRKVDHLLASRLSGGQLARLSLGASLLGRPRLLVLDEPTVGLDPVLRGDLWALFHRLADDGVTLLVSSHVMDEAARCDRLLLMRAGRLIADATQAEILRTTGAESMDDAFVRLVRSHPREAPPQRSADGARR